MFVSSNINVSWPYDLFIKKVQNKQFWLYYLNIIYFNIKITRLQPDNKTSVLFKVCLGIKIHGYENQSKLYTVYYKYFKIVIFITIHLYVYNSLKIKMSIKAFGMRIPT